MYALILFFPLLSFILSASWGFYLGRLGSSFISVLLLGLSFCLSLFIAYEVGLCQIPAQVELFSWSQLDLFTIKFSLFFDSVTVSMLVVITSISFFVHLYSIEYMSHDPHLNRFMSYLSLFTFFMLILVTADNFVQLFLGWEGVGLCSYLLISFWFTRILANKAALKAMLMNRIADVFFIIAIFLLLVYCGSSDYQIVFTLLPYLAQKKLFFWGVSFPLVEIIGFFLFLGAIGKSAQLGFHTWLPDAMEGPTPVSALLHAATMVTAGVFLIIRSSPIFEYSSFCLFLIALFGGLTAFFFSFSAIMQFDLKKVIAYSTCSQLGYMFLACGLSFYNVGLFHLFNHAFFKALLFLSAGAIIHALNDEQDMRRMGGLVNFLPFTFFCMLFGSLAIMGFPFLTGFYSKDLLLELLLGSYKVDFLFFYFLALMAAFFTATYSLRLLLMVFFFRPNFFLISLPTESHGFISISLFSLAFFSLIFGYLFSDLFVGWGSFFSFFALPANVFPLEVLLLSPLERNLPLIFSLAGSLISTGFLIFFHEKPTINLVQNNFFKNVYGGFLRGLAHLSAFFYFSGFFNVVYNRVFINFYKFSYKLDTKLIDKGLLEFLGPVGFYRFFYNISRRVWAINSSVFLNIGFMMFFFILFYIYIIFSQGFLLFHVVHYGALVVGLLAVYNEFTPSL